MKLQYTTKNNKFTVELEADKQTDLIEQLANFQEVFEETVCLKCKKDNLRWQVRQDTEENKYYELVCLEGGCRAKLAFGCHKKPSGGVFPKRKNDEGKFKGVYGWVRWNAEKKCEE